MEKVLYNQFQVHRGILGISHESYDGRFNPADFPSHLAIRSGVALLRGSVRIPDTVLQIRSSAAAFASKY
jgi:hypothetical protein